MWDVYISGNFDMVVAAYNALAMMFSDGHNIYYGAAVISLLFLFITALLRVSDDSHKPVQNFFFGWIIFMVLAGPTTRVTVLVESRVTQQVQTVDNVPLLVAISGSIATTLLSRITEDLQTAFDVITPMTGSGVMNTGTIDPLRALMKLNQQDYENAAICMLGGGNVDFCGTLNNYVRDCVGRDLITGGPAQDVSINRIMNAGPTDIMDALKTNNPTWTTQNVVLSGSPTTYTCDGAFNYVKSAFASPQFKAQVDAYNQKIGIDGNAIDQATAMLTGSGISVYDMALQRMLWSATKNGLIKTFDRVGLQTEQMQFTAKEQRLVKMASSYEMFNELAPALITFFEFFSIFIAPMLLLMLVTGRFGLQAAGSYVMFVLFTNLWPLIAVGVESYLNYALITDMSSSGNFGPSALSWSGSPGVLEKAQTYLAVGSMMMAAIPSLAMAVLYRGVHSMQGVAKQASPDAPVNAHYVAPNLSSAPDNGGVKIGATKATWDPSSNTGVGVVSSDNGPLSTVVQSGSAVGNAISKNLTAANQRMDQAAASAQDSYSHVMQAGQQAMNTMSSSDGTTAQLGKNIAATQAAVSAYSKAFDVSQGEAAAIIAADANGASKSLQAKAGAKIPELLGINPLTGSLDFSASTNASESNSRSTSETSGTGRSAGKSSSSSNSMSDTVNAMFNTASSYLTGHSMVGNASYTDAASHMVNSTRTFTDAKSVVDQMGAAQTATQNGSLTGSIDLGQLGQRAQEAGNVFDAQQTVDRVMAQNADARESLYKAGVIDGDGKLTSEASLRINEIADSANFKAGGGLSNVAASSIGAASYLVETGMKLTGGLDVDDRASAAAVYRDMNQTAPDAALQQLIQVNEAASLEDKVRNYVDLTDGGAAIKSELGAGGANVQRAAGAEFGEAQSGVNAAPQAVENKSSGDKEQTFRAGSWHNSANQGTSGVQTPLRLSEEVTDRDRLNNTAGYNSEIDSSLEALNQNRENMKDNISVLNVLGDGPLAGLTDKLPTHQEMNQLRGTVKEVGAAIYENPVFQKVQQDLGKTVDDVTVGLNTVKGALTEIADVEKLTGELSEVFKDNK